MNPVRTALKFPQVTLVLFALLFAVGVAALATMPRREDPKITIHTGLIVAVYPGASSTEVEDRVTRPIEERLFRFSEIRRAKTFSTSRNGVVVVNVELNKSVVNADEFWSKLRLALAQLKQSDLPAEVRGPVVDSDFGDTVAVMIAIHGNGRESRELTEVAKTVEARLRAIPAVSKIRRIGEQKERIEVAASSERLAASGVNLQHVANALKERNTVAYGGAVPTDQNKVPIATDGALTSEDAIRRAIVDVPAGGRPVHVGDLATVSRVYADPTQFARVNGEQTVLLSVEMNEGNNIVFFGHDLQQALEELKPSIPAGVDLDLVANQPQVVRERVFDFFREFGIAILSVIFVTMLLLPMRVALVSAVAIPVTVATTFGLLNVCGVELQQVSIAALITVLGMVVDDAIVIADNYVELLDRKLAPDEAAWKSATEMAVPVLTATLTIIASFAPMLLLSGAVGEFIRALPIAVAIALATSYVVAMTLTPLTARFFIRQGLVNHASEAELSAEGFSPLAYMQGVYNRAITLAMLHRKLVLWAGAAIFAVGVLLLQFVPQQFFPLAERNQFVLDVWLPEGAKIEATDAVVRRIEAVLKTETQVVNATSFVGSSAPRFYYNVNPQPPATNYAQILVNTVQAKQTPALVGQLRNRLPMLAPEAKIYVKELQQGQVMEAPVEVRIVGPDRADLATMRLLGDQVEQLLRHSAGAAYIHTDWHEDEWQLKVKLQEEVANRMGLTDATVAGQLGGEFDGAPVTTLWEADRAVDVALRLSEMKRQSADNLAETYVVSPVSGVRVPLGAIATLVPAWEPGRIVHRNGVPTLTVRAFAVDGRLASQILGDVQASVKKLQLPAGYRVEYGGEFENQNETFSELQKALLVSLVLIFLILLFQFRSFLDPLIIMTAFPLALPGAALGLLLTRNNFGFTAFIGIVSLGGLVVRNSIILIDYIHVRLNEGVRVQQAALEAGERRLRPIFLTTMAAAVGVTPMILSRSSLWSPLASVIAFGLLGSMMFTLVVIPVLFVVVHERWGRAHRLKHVVAVLLLLVFCSAAAQAEKRRLTLDEAVDLAAQSNPTVRMAHLKARAMRATVTQARANYFPQLATEGEAVHAGRNELLRIPMGALGVYSGVGAIPGKEIDLQLGNRNFLLDTTTLAQPLSQLYKIHAGVSVARADAAIASSDAHRADDEVELNVRKLYLALLTTTRRREAVALRLQAGQMKLAEAHNGVESGTLLQVKELEGRAQLAEAHHALGQLDDAIADEQVEFNHLLGLPLETELELAEPVLKAEPAQPAQLEAEALGGNPAVASAAALLAKARAAVAAARAEFIPDVSAVGQYIYQSGVPLLAENNGLVGLNVKWTLGEFGKRTGLLQQRTAERAAAEVNLQAVRSRVRVDVQKQVRRLMRSESALEAARQSVQARTELKRIVANQVQAGTANPSAEEEAAASLAEAQASLFQAEVDRALASAELNCTVGR